MVIVNPSAPVGPRDVKPTPTGQVIVDFLNRRMPAYLDTGLNWVHVRDVAVGHILAAEKGRVGERYILGNAEGNWTMKRTFEVLQEITGVPAPKWRIPYAVAFLAAGVDEFNPVLRHNRPAPRSPACGWRRTKCSSIPPKPSVNLACPRLRPNRPSPTPSNGFTVMVT